MISQTPNGSVDPSSSLEPEKQPCTTAPPWTAEGWSPLQLQSREQQRLHARHEVERRRVAFALWEDGGDDLRKRAWRLDGCCAVPVVYQAKDGSGAVSLGSCRDRLCPRCQHQRGREVAARLAERVKAWNACRFITLTLRGTDATLADTMSSLAAAFRRLRKDPVWAEAVLGGVYSIEVTRGASLDHWHAHLHVLADGFYLDQGMLSDAWERASGGSRVVDIRAVHDRGAYAHYIAAYVAKPDRLSEWAPEHIAEYARATHGRRMIHAFGCHHAPDPNRAPNTQLEFCREEHADAEPQKCVQLCTLAWLRKRGKTGCSFAVSALTLLAQDLKSVRSVLDADEHWLGADGKPLVHTSLPPTLSDLVRLSKAAEDRNAHPPPATKPRKKPHPRLAEDWLDDGPRGTGPR